MLDSVLICIFLGLYTLPSIILCTLQFKHIKAQLDKPAILLEKDDYINAGEYELKSLKLSIIEHIFNAICFVIWVSFGLALLQNYLDSLPFGLDFSQSLLGGVCFVLGYMIISAVIELPFSVYKIFVLDRQYGFSKQTPMLFISDSIKQLLLSIIIGGAIVALLIYIIESVSLWWLMGFIVVFFVLILSNILYPTIFAPLFNKFTPLNDENLKGKIESLMDKVGFKSSGIFVMDASRRDGRLNAYFGGFGKAKRVVLFDTLLDKISSEGLIAILGHELGHFKHLDLFKHLAVISCVFFILFFVAGHLPNALFSSIGIEYSGGSILVILTLISPIVLFWYMPIFGFFSRKAEYSADRFGAELSSKYALANALVRLVNENKKFPSSHSAYIFFYYSHPPLLQRLKALDYEVK